jgi:lysophosphatidylcholine acyltransferase/lyso-PAF acetyltransferase
LVIYPEGTTTNGTCILPFKKGAFMAETTYKPVVLKYSDRNSFSTSYDCIRLDSLIFMNLSWCFMRATVLDLPEFQPNEYLFKKHADKGKERWEIIAWALRDIMSKAGKLRKNELKIRDKRFY